LSKGIGSVSFEYGSISLVTGPRGSSENGKSELVASEEIGLGSSDFVFLVEDCSSDDGDGIGGSSVVSAQLSVELTDGSVEGDITKFLIHIVVGGS
jgi:hypothetical protein